ncbi:hypothetical protein CCR80_06375 [Rhodothalassium salexigens]|uniref:protein-L-isoaspartate O-methyltransferase family protein n=1 Tax=Rhodothalassium salexigens TaxID=1086 RepID=UPI001912D654|nr:hypothetical protein [Rhodothalassium salexigens]MBK5920663.1 hypothetical protein [Rhodothalassium salexigens]
MAMGGQDDGAANPSRADDLAGVRQRFAARVLRDAGVDDARLGAAFAAVSREAFLPPGPWSIGAGGGGFVTTSDPADLYADCLVAIDPGRGLNNGQPSLHARMLHALAPPIGGTVVHIGAGRGYYTAILAHLVGPGGAVLGIEIVRDLAQAAQAALDRAGLGWAGVRHGDGHGGGASLGAGADLGVDAADGVYVNAGLAGLVPEWVAVLKPGGRLVMPLTLEPDLAGTIPRWGRVLVVEARAHSAASGVYAARLADPVAFVGCVGQRDRRAQARLAEAVHAGRLDRLASVRLDVPQAEEARAADPLLSGPGWALSALPAD